MTLRRVKRCFYSCFASPFFSAGGEPVNILISLIYCKINQSLSHAHRVADIIRRRCGDTTMVSSPNSSKGLGSIDPPPPRPDLRLFFLSSYSQLSVVMRCLPKWASVWVSKMEGIRIRPFSSTVCRYHQNWHEYCCVISNLTSLIFQRHGSGHDVEEHKRNRNRQVSSHSHDRL